jgi:hypothetical protein
MGTAVREPSCSYPLEPYIRGPFLHVIMGRMNFRRLSFKDLKRGLRQRILRFEINLQIQKMARQVAQAAPRPEGAPVVVFNASTRLSGLNQNSAFSLLSAWGLRLAGIPVVHFTCQRGLRPCILGTDRADPAKPPPCRECIAQSRTNTTAATTRWFTYQSDLELEQAIQQQPLNKLSHFTWKLETGPNTPILDVPLGELVLPSARWIQRRHYLLDDQPTRDLLRRYILSAWNVVREFNRLLDETHPRAVLAFNGITYPEAAARWAAQQRGIPVITHEVSLQPFSGYFTAEDATFRSFPLPEDFTLSTDLSARLDAYLEKRFKGSFSMAGVKFWKEMRPLGEEFWQHAAAFKQIVPVFTNVIFDTSQFHANTVFEDMFDWLEAILKLIRQHPETLFVIRAHPDESRPGKESINSVAEWVKRRGVEQLPNALFVPPQEYFSSYELIQRSKFVMVYTSTIGLEATLMGAPVLCGGNSQYNQVPTAFFEPIPAAYCQTAESFLAAEKIEVPPAYIHNARRFLYYSLYHASLPFGDFITEDNIWQGYVRLKRFSLQALQSSPTLRTVVEGIRDAKLFILPWKSGQLR